MIMAPGPVFEYLDKIEGECSRYSVAEPLGVNFDAIAVMNVMLI